MLLVQDLQWNEEKKKKEGENTGSPQTYTPVVLKPTNFKK
jgi:hypothetical protein